MTNEKSSNTSVSNFALVSSGLFEQIDVIGKGTVQILTSQRRHNDAIKTPKTP
ncbi:MAG: hypothetical protein O8C55_01250 [Candidatus Methanoperedens sp.]|nr:hypothetical protein [Candidatus Methanoperedens sp.]